MVHSTDIKPRPPNTELADTTIFAAAYDPVVAATCIFVRVVHRMGTQSRLGGQNGPVCGVGR